MTFKALITTISLITFAFFVNAQDTPLGVWETIDDKTGEIKSHVEIFEENGILYGKIVKLVLVGSPEICDKCPGDKKGKPLVGMVILEGLQKNNDYWSSGTILDPENGKSYKCKLYLEEDGKLRLRGYIGIETLGRSMYWQRI